LFDGHQTKPYTTPTFGTTTRTVPTLNELRGQLDDTHRDGLTWDDVNNYRARDQFGHVIDANETVAGVQAAFTGQALLLDMNPHFDLTHLNPNDNDSSTHWDSAVTAKVNGAIAALSASLTGGSSFGLVGGQLTLHLATAQNTANGPLPPGDYTGAQAMSLWVNFANFSITAPDNLYNAVGELLMASVGDHYVAGDGRANENFGLTSLHHVFHENHNVQLVNFEAHILADPNADQRHGYEVQVHAKTGDINGAGVTTVHVGPVLATPTTAAVAAYDYYVKDQNYVDAAGNISWNQDKVFSATKFINEMEYQHVAIDQYARLVTPDLPE
jgi:hypothetical protein